MAAILHCLFRHCFEQNRDGDDDDHDSDDPDYPSGGGGRGGADNSTALSAAVSRRRGGGLLRRSGSPFVEEDHNTGTGTGTGGDGGGCEHASSDPTSPVLAQSGSDDGGGGGGFFRRWLHHGEVGVGGGGGAGSPDSADGSAENLLRGGSGGGGGGRRSYSPLAPPPGADPSVASASSSGGVGARPPLLPPDFRGLLGLVRRTSADLQAKLSENFAPPHDDTEKDGLTSTGSIHSHSLKEAVEFDFSTGKEIPTISLNEVVVPGSELQRAMARQMSARGEEADGGGTAGAPGDECVICMDGFSPENPRMPTLCGCGENKTYFHLPCLYQWIDQCRECPSCRKKLVWEEF